MKDLTDLRLASLFILSSDVKDESIKQIGKWGIQTRTPFEWMCYLTEEVGELADAIAEEHYRDGTAEHVYEEAIQVATLALKIAEMYRKEI